MSDKQDWDCTVNVTFRFIRVFATCKLHSVCYCWTQRVLQEVIAVSRLCVSLQSQFCVELFIYLFTVASLSYSLLLYQLLPTTTMQTAVAKFSQMYFIYDMIYDMRYDTIRYDMIYDIWYMIYDIWYMIWYMIWYDMIWYDMIWYDMIWYDMIWYMIWYDMIWYDMIWYDMIWYDMIWYMIWYDMIWYDMIWHMIWYMIYDMIWYDMIWYDMIWYDMIWYDMIWYDFRCWYLFRFYSRKYFTHSPEVNFRMQSPNFCINWKWHLCLHLGDATNMLNIGSFIMCCLFHNSPKPLINIRHLSWIERIPSSSRSSTLEVRV